MENKLKELRSSQRLNFSGPLRCQVRGSQEIVDTLSENLSLSGIKFINDKFIPPYTSVMLEINLLSQIVRPIAEIIWSSPFLRQDKFHLGTRFLEWSPMDKKNFSIFLNTRLYYQ